MKARMFVVNESTIDRVCSEMEVTAIVPEPYKNGKPRRDWLKTIEDIASDLLQVEIGDYIFLWESGTQNIYGVYRAISRPFYKKEEGRADIFRIKIDKVYDFKTPIHEYDIINNPHMKSKLWNIIGKKVVGKSRATTPITCEEMQFLIQSLISVNSDFQYYPDYIEYHVDNELAFNIGGCAEVDVPNSVSEYVYEPFKVRRGKEVYYEKALEGIMNIWIRDKNDEQLSALDINAEHVCWYANNLPYGIEQSQMDYMIMESRDGINISRIDVIELKKDIIDCDHIERCVKYARWVEKAISNENKIVRPVLVCGVKSKTSRNGFCDSKIQEAIRQLPTKYGFDKMDVYTYEITDEKIKFEKYLGESINE